MCLGGLNSPPEEGDFVLDGRQSVKWPLQQKQTIIQAGSLTSVQADLHFHNRPHAVSVLFMYCFYIYFFSMTKFTTSLLAPKFTKFFEHLPHPLLVKMSLVLQHLAALCPWAFLLLMPLSLVFLSPVLCIFHLTSLPTLCY